MEKKIKHRILGLIVIIGIFLIILPLLDADNELTIKEKIVQPPPFPDQTIQVNSPEKSPPAPKEVTLKTQEPAITFETIPLPNTPQIPKPADEPIDEPAPAVKPLVINKEINATKTINDSVLAKAQIPPEEKKVTKDIIKLPASLSHSPTVKTLSKKHSSKNIVSLEKPYSAHIKPKDSSLLEIKNSVWVIQLGNFKTKTTALKFINQLRLNGFNAFMQELTFGNEDKIRIFVGPMPKQETAKLVAAKIYRDMKIRGLIITYQPLNL